ncbi:MAG TPA: hypothetical protein VN751_14380 [Solirubrobacteraceae bacterium]|jgi:hypothetical protein|nr:hypothetical protein [Solirubrobacteraceae bacterium]
MPTKTQREREAEQRKQKLDRIQEQVEEGSLVIRQMTDEERARFTRPEPPRVPASRRRSPRNRRPLPPRVPRS